MPLGKVGEDEGEGVVSGVSGVTVVHGVVIGIGCVC